MGKALKLATEANGAVIEANGVTTENRLTTNGEQTVTTGKRWTTEKKRNRSIMVDPFLEKVLRHALRTHSTAAFEGVPGIGKTAGILAFCEKYGYTCDAILMSLYDYQDITGWPIVTKETVDIEGVAYPVLRYAPTNFAIRAATEKKHIIFLDEINSGNPQQAVLANRIIHEKKIGDITLDPRRVAIVAAFNRPELATAGSDLTPPTVNRLELHLDYTPNKEFFVKGFPSYWGNAPELGFGDDGLDMDPVSWSWARAVIAEFVRKNGVEKFCHIPEEEVARTKPFVTPRSLDHASRKIGSVRQDKGQIEEAIPLMQGWVGQLAVELATFAAEQDQRDPEDILEDELNAFNGHAVEENWKRDRAPKFQVPAEGDKAFALLCSTCEAVVGNFTPARGVALWRILWAAAEQGAKGPAASSADSFFKKWAKDRTKLPPIVDEAKPFLAYITLIGKYVDPSRSKKTT